MQEAEALSNREENATEAKKRRALGQRKTAVFDGDEIHLRWEDADGNGDDIEWPATWPPRVNQQWLVTRGYRVILL